MAALPTNKGCRIQTVLDIGAATFDATDSVNNKRGNRRLNDELYLKRAIEAAEAGWTPSTDPTNYCKKQMRCVYCI